VAPDNRFVGGDDPEWVESADGRRRRKAEILISSLPNVDAFEQVMAGQGGIARGPTAALDQGAGS
jgi:hypothetical protein